jgi:uncharacterized protein DUF2252
MAAADIDVDIVEATRSYEAWLASQIRVVPADLRTKHDEMARDAFVFLRGTFYRWIQRWPALCASVADAPRVLSVGDLHVENFGTWRDAEGRLIWGVNDIDEACRLPYTHDLVRLAVSAWLAVRAGHFALSNRAVCDALIDGYTASIERGSRPIVLAERRRWLRRLALNELRAPANFWAKLHKGLAPARGDVPHAVLKDAMPPDAAGYQAYRRSAGVGSRGRPRFLALADWAGGLVAREAKAWLPSAAVWAGVTARGDVAPRLLAQAARAADPCYRIRIPWIVRRLAPDCSKIEMSDLPAKRDELRLLRAMGWETANMHTGLARSAVKRDLSSRRRRWLLDAAGDMVDATVADWREWQRFVARNRA